MNEILIEIYKTRIEIVGRNYDINNMLDFGYLGNSFDEIKNLKPTQEEYDNYRLLRENNVDSEAYKILKRKLSIWKLLDSCIDNENNSIGDLVDKILLLQNENESSSAALIEKEYTEENTQKYLLFFDTETTGLPRNYKAPLTDLDNWPRLVQLAYILSDFKGNILQKGDWIIKPNGYIIPNESSVIHRITNERANNEGLPLKFVLQNFENLIKISDCLVAHNMSFDEKIVSAEFLRSGMENFILDKKRICTMEKTTNFCALESQYGFKWPKLSELYFILFNESFEEAHNAAHDINATAKCFWELKNRQIIVID